MQQGESLNSQVPVLEAFNHFPQYVIFGNFRKKISGNGRRGTEVRKPTRKPPAFAKLAPAEVFTFFTFINIFGRK